MFPRLFWLNLYYPAAKFKLSPDLSKTYKAPTFQGWRFVISVPSNSSALKLFADVKSRLVS